jgi:hypothetical protein
VCAAGCVPSSAHQFPGIKRCRPAQYRITERSMPNRAPGCPANNRLSRQFDDRRKRCDLMSGHRRGASYLRADHGGGVNTSCANLDHRTCRDKGRSRSWTARISLRRTVICRNPRGRRRTRRGLHNARRQQCQQTYDDCPATRTHSRFVLARATRVAANRPVRSGSLLPCRIRPGW